MIDPKELRIGNYVRDIAASDQFFAKVKKISRTRCHYGIFHSAYSDLKPIPITEEILLRCGFEKRAIGLDICISNFPDHEFKRLVVDINQGILIRCGDKKHSRDLDELISIYNIDISGKIYLHRLQNLIFDLTGKELEMKQTS